MCRVLGTPWEAERDTKAHVDDAEKKREDAEKAAVCAENAVPDRG